MSLGRLVAVVDELVVADPSELSDRHTIVELKRQLARLEAVDTRATAAFDASKVWSDDRAWSAANWLSIRCHLPLATTRRQVRLGRGLRHLPACERAWLAGDINAAHVNTLCRARRPATEEAMAEDEEMLVRKAKALRYDHFHKAVAYWLLRNDADGEDKTFEDKRAQRAVHLSRSFEDMWFGDMTFDPVSGAVVSKMLKAIEHELFEADWAEAKTRLGREPTVMELARTPAQRRADAMVDMAVRASTSPADGRRPEPLFSILVGYETFEGMLCELADGTVIPPGSLLPWIDQAWIERIVMDGPSRVVDVGVTQRLFTGATRRAIQIRDRECFEELCDLAADDCQIDHIIPYSAGGPTTQDNGRVACGKHNRARHKHLRPDP